MQWQEGVLRTPSIEEIQNPRLRSLVAMECSREIPKWQMVAVIDPESVMLETKPKLLKLTAIFWFSLFSGLIFLVIYGLYFRRKSKIRRMISANDSPELENYLMAPFTEFMKNDFSQAGEDGVIFEVLKRLELADPRGKKLIVVEFGAWDGKHLSNTFSLVKRGLADAFYIEGDKKRFASLKKTSTEYPSITPINAFVAPGLGANSLDRLLCSVKCPKEIDVLSIDIDSCDLDIWENFEYADPKIVVIEINSSIPPGVLMRQGVNIEGNSFSATLKVAQNKGYSLVHHTGNMIFVKDELLAKLDLPRRYIIYPELLFRSEEVQSFHSPDVLNGPQRAAQQRRNRFKLYKGYLKLTYKVISLTHFDRLFERITR